MTIELLPREHVTCDGLWDNIEDRCSDPAIAVVTDEAELLIGRHLCDVHLLLHLADVVPLFHNLEEAAK